MIFKDVFGPSINNCVHCKIERDYVMDSLGTIAAFYGGSGLVLVILNVIGKRQFGTYWRFVGFFTLAALEGAIVMQRLDPLPYILPQRTSAEKITLLHQLFVIFFIALSQIGPFFQTHDTRTLNQILQSLENLTNIELKESFNVFRANFEPFQGKPVQLDLLRRKMEKLIVDLRLLEEPDLHSTYSRVQKSEMKSSKSK